jgi:hypothetical protein
MLATGSCERILETRSPFRDLVLAVAESEIAGG